MPLSDNEITQIDKLHSDFVSKTISEQQTYEKKLADLLKTHPEKDDEIDSLAHLISVFLRYSNRNLAILSRISRIKPKKKV